MRIKISNIGKIKEADVAINGITVIAGENNTGKSTVGKALYAIFNSFVDVAKKVEEERIDSLQRSIFTFLQEISGSNMGFPQVDGNALATKLNDIKNEINKEKIIQVLADKLNLKTSVIENNYSRLEPSINNILRVLSVSNDNYLKILVQKNFSEEFNQQINNILENTNGEIDLTIKQKVSSVKFDDNIVVFVNKQVDIFSDAIYLDDPFILDERPSHGFLATFFNSNGKFYRHKDKLGDLIYKQVESNNLVDKIVIEERLQKIIDKVHGACRGRTFFKNNNDLMYQQDNMKTAFKVANLSTGLKTFVILQTLLLSGAIKDGSLIILDEPEIHLHPEWQLLFAELIVMLQKEFNLHILLNTHSPYFLNAIEVFSEKYAIGDRCEYYLAYNKQDESYVKCVTGNVEEIYAKLARPLQRLENLRYADDE